MSTHKDGIANAEAIAAEFGVDPAKLRQFASNHLQEVCPYLEEVGSSDVSIHLADLGNHEPEVLRLEAARLKEQQEFVAEVAARTGRPAEEVLAGLQRLLGPVEGSAE